MPKNLHEAWNNLFDNLPVPNVARLLSEYWSVFGNGVGIDNEIRQIANSVLKDIIDFEKFLPVLSEEEKTSIRREMAKHRFRIKKMNAWRLLFGGKSIEEIVSEINEVWIDPDFRLTVEMIESPKIEFRSSTNS